MSKTNVAVLVGNGLSIAFNPALGLGNLTTEVVKRMGETTDSEEAVRDAMRRIADRYSTDGQADYSDFENIVGAFGGQSSMLDELTRMASLVEPENEDLQKAIALAGDFALKVRDAGVSHVLEVIFEQSRAHPDLMDDLYELTRAIVGAFDGKVTFGNLNYDTLLLSALLETCQGILADMGHGWKEGQVTTGKGKRKHTFQTLRRVLDFPAYARVRLLHLHGSLTFWGLAKGEFLKLSTAFLDQYKPWLTVRSGGTKLRPAVVLANQRDKSGVIVEHPYSLAYKAFAAALAESDHWLVIGYSFRDIGVNALFESELRSRSNPPAMAVVTMGESPRRKQVESAIGWDVARGDTKPWLKFDRKGASGLHNRPSWANFVPD